VLIAGPCHAADVVALGAVLDLVAQVVIDSIFLAIPHILASSAEKQRGQPGANPGLTRGQPAPPYLDALLHLLLLALDVPHLPVDAPRLRAQLPLPLPKAGQTVPATSSTRISNPRLLSHMASYDAASNI